MNLILKLKKHCVLRKLLESYLGSCIGFPLRFFPLLRFLEISEALWDVLADTELNTKG